MGIGVLGPLIVDGEPPALPRRDRVVLEALAVDAGVAVPADRLADALWNGTPPASWSKVVQSSIVRLRKVLGRDVIQTLPDGYQLTLAPHDIDAREFERLVDRSREQLLLGQADRAAYALDEALGLWRGRALGELAEWERGRTEADRLEELRRDAEELRCEAGLEAGRHRELLVELQRLVRAAPLRERRWELLALAEYRAGRQGDALRTIRQVKQLLLDELGLDAGPGLLALEQAILRQDDGLAPAPREEPDTDVECPYLGLVPYDVDDADAFFGRDRDVAACLDRLRRARVLVVVGPSGSGKSSLVRAGVAATRRREGTRVVVITPGTHPRDALAALPARTNGVLLVVDQCEQVLSLCDDREEQRAFFAALAAHAEAGELVVALRADRLGDLAAFPVATRLVERGLYLLNPMGEDDLRSAIEAPARQAGLRIEPGLVELLIAEVAGEPGALPLLSHVLRETWARREGPVLTVDAYRATGGVRHAVADSAEALYERVTVGERSLLRDLLLRLVAPTAEGDPVRMKVPRRLLAGDPTRDRLVEELVRARLVTSDDGVVEVAHEALSRAWPRLRGWLDEDTEGQRILRHLSVAADTWVAMGRPDSELYRGTRLARALDWRDQSAPDLTPAEREFLDAGWRLADAEERSAADQARYQARVNRRLRVLLVAGAALLVLALVAGVLAFDQRGEARRAAEASDLRALRAQAQAEPRLDVALLLAAQAVRRDGSDESRAALLEVARRAPQAVAVLPVRDRLLSLAVGGGGRLLGATGSEGSGHVWDVRTREVLASLPRLGFFGTGSVDLSADGRFLVAVDAPVAETSDEQELERHALVVDLDADQPAVRRLPGPPLAAARFGPGRNTLVTLGLDGRLRTVDPRTGDPVAPRAAAEGPQTPLVLESTALEGSADRRTMVAYDIREPNLLSVWDARSGRPLWARSESDGVVAAVDPDGRSVVIGHTDGRIEHVDVRHPRRSREVRSFLGGALTDVAWAPDGSTFAGAAPDGAVAVWDARRLEPIAMLGGASGRVSQLGYAADGSTLYAAGQERAVIAWDLTGRRGLVRSFGGRAPVDAVGSAMSGDGSTVATLLADGALRVRTPADGTAFVIDGLQRGGPGGLVLDRTGRRLAFIDSGWPDGELMKVRVRDTGRPAAPPYSLTLAPSRGYDAAFSDDGRLLVTADDDVVRVQEARTGRHADGFSGYSASGPVSFVGLHPDNRTVAAMRVDEALEIGDLRTGRHVAMLLPAGGSNGDRINMPPRFSPDGRWLATGSDSGAVTLWETATWDVVVRWLAVPGGSVDALAFTPDSERLAVAGAGEASMWAVGSRPGTPLRLSPDPLSAGGSILLAAGVDTVTTHTDAAGTSRWQVSADALVRHACAVAGRDLSAVERAAVATDWPWEPTCSGDRRPALSAVSRPGRGRPRRRGAAPRR
jgi:WD40 repeat protein/DNA-binding SARP family transcriptional activator